MSTQCLGNVKQLQLASLLYSGDNNDFLPPNGWAYIEWSEGCPQGFSSAAGSWVMGEASAAKTDTGIRNGCLFHYTKEAKLYHCPADRSTVDGYQHVLRKRSYSLSFYMNGSKVKGYAQVKAKLSEIRQASTSLGFIDEHEETIDDGVFFLHLPGDKGEQTVSREAHSHFQGAHWMAMPSDRHNRGSNLSYADGSAEFHKWRWPKKLLTDRSPVNDQDFTDLRWLQSGIPDVGVQWFVSAGANGGQ